VITAATLSIADRDARWLRGLRPLVGLAAVALAVVPWLYAIERATQGRFLEQSVGHDFWAKVMGGQEAHGAPPLYFLGMAFLTFWPGSLYLLPAVIGGVRRRAEPAVRFLLAWLVPAWIVLELVPTKLPHYVLPLYPALALLAAASLGVDMPRWMRTCRIIGMVLWLLATLGLAAALIALPINLDHGAAAAGIAGAVALVILAAVLLYWRPEPRGVAALVVLLALACVAPAASVVLPDLDRLWLSRAAAAIVEHDPPPDGTKLTVIGYNEPSLVFLLNDDITTGMADAPVAAGGEALVGDRQDAAFKANLAARGLVATAVDSVRGIDYSNGQRMTLTLYRIGPR